MEASIPVPYCTRHGTYTTEEAASILEGTSSDDSRVCGTPPVKPKGGDVFLYFAEKEECKDDWRSDQYRWCNKGVTSLPRTNPLVKKHYFWIDTPEGPLNSFTRSAYMLPGCKTKVLIHYMGNENVAKDFPHGNQKKHSQRNYCKQCPSMRASIKTEVSRTNPAQAYKVQVASAKCHPSQMKVLIPRDLKMVRNMKYTCNQEKRISQDSLYNLHEISYDLPQFVWLIQTFPDLVCVCGIKEILDQLDRVLLIESANPQLLSYDTTFQLGDFYVSTLLFRHTIFKESPVIPALFLIHERKFQTTHEILFRIANEKVPSLAKSVCPIVTDEEKAINNAIANIIPNVKRLRCWNHIFRGARHWLRSHNISNSKVQEFIAELRELFHKPSLQDYEKAYQSVSPEWDKRIHEYYSKNILPEVNLSVGRWVLEEKGVYSPFSGVVNNQSESFNAILKDLQHWKEVPIDSLILTFYYLQCYFMNEICREMCNQGSYHLHPTFSILLEEAEEKDFIANCVQPDEIVKHIKEGLIADEFTVVEPDHELQMCDTIPTSAPLSQMARAKILIEAGKISFDPKLHLFNVLGSGDNPYVVRLFPTEFCSCPSKGQCYHIIAVKTSIGAMVDTKLNPLKNLNLLRKNTRSRNDKRSGRKRPRRKDMTTDENDSPSNPKKMDTNDDPLDNSGSTHENPEGNLTNPGEDVLIPDENIPSVNSPPRYVGEENAPPGASMIYESPIIVSEKMQHVISENDNMFEHKPIGPLYNFIPQQLQSFLPPAFLHSYVVVTHQDKSALDELFNQHQEPYPVVITFPYCDKIYSDVIDDPKSASTTVKILQGMNPILANVLIDYYEVHTWKGIPDYEDTLQVNDDMQYHNEDSMVSPKPVGDMHQDEMKAKSTELAKDLQSKQAVNHKLKRNEAAYKLTKAIKERRQQKIQTSSGSDGHLITVPDHFTEGGNKEFVKFWIEDLVLLDTDKAIIQSNSWLNSSIIDATQKILSQQFPSLEGFQSVGCGQGMTFNNMHEDFIQILHDEQRKHWLTITNIGTTEPNVLVYDSLFHQSSPCIQQQISCIMNTNYPEIVLHFADSQRQNGAYDCGLFAIAFAVSICYGNLPGNFRYAQSEMREHLLKCLNSGMIEEFPKKERRSKMKIIKTQTIKVYCTCRMPRMEDEPMISCDKCKEWYHADICVKTPRSLWLTKAKTWLCNICEQNLIN